eukprot:COSAG02_NODE_49730_length_325_cov_0.672566_1_plen_44_part_01
MPQRRSRHHNCNTGYGGRERRSMALFAGCRWPVLGLLLARRAVR